MYMYKIYCYTYLLHSITLPFCITHMIDPLSAQISHYWLETVMNYVL